MEITLKNLSVFGNTAEAKIAKSGTSYVKCTAIERDGDGNIARFLNLCFFPDADKVIKLRDILCQGRILNVRGNYSERTYTGKDGTEKTAYDMLCHKVEFGGIEEWEGGERKTTDFSFIKEADEKAANAEADKNEKKRAAKAHASKQKTTTIESAVMDDEFFKDLDI